MRLDKDLVRRGLCESRTEAQECIDKGFVIVNGVVCTKQTRSSMETDSIVVTARRVYVSRGGEKLQGVMLDVFGGENEVRDFCRAKIALDIGSSTGGFTDFLLQHGVTHVDCVDVGTQQLHERLRGNPQISLFENTDIRTFVSQKKYDIIVTDLSFIPLQDVLSHIVAFGSAGKTHYFLLIKPQFEVGKGNTKKGIVKDVALVKDVLVTIETQAQEEGLQGVHIFPCRIQGGDGNQEYFLYGKV